MKTKTLKSFNPISFTIENEQEAVALMTVCALVTGDPKKSRGVIDAIYMALTNAGVNYRDENFEPILPFRGEINFDD